MIAFSLTLGIFLFLAQSFISSYGIKVRLNYHGPLLLLTPSTYTELSLYRYCWSLFYYLLYTYTLLFLCSAVVIVFPNISTPNIRALSEIMTIRPLGMFLIGAVGFVLFYIGNICFLRPYICLVLGAATRITPRMQEYYEYEALTKQFRISRLRFDAHRSELARRSMIQMSGTNSDAKWTCDSCGQAVGDLYNECWRCWAPRPRP